MKTTDKNDDFSDAEAERRATDALRRTLTTPYKPQKAMVGKVGRPVARERVSTKARPKAS